MKSALLAALRWYKRSVSPLLPPACRYTPTCSEYARQALARHGLLLGSRNAEKTVSARRAACFHAGAARYARSPVVVKIEIELFPILLY